MIPQLKLSIAKSEPLGAAPRVVLCIGAQKAGTTWLYDYLKDHPSVHLPPVKEVHYFESRFKCGPDYSLRSRETLLKRLQSSSSFRLKQSARRALETLGLEALDPKGTSTVPSTQDLKLLIKMHRDDDPDHRVYREVLTRRYKGQPVVVDITPGYDLLKAEHFAEILRAFPDIRIVFLMRDPVKRALSAMGMIYRNLFAKTGLRKAQFGQEIIQGKAQHRHLIIRSSYQDTIRELEATVPKDRILYLFYEDLFTDLSIKKLCQFIDIPFKKGDYERVVFAGKGPKFRNPALRRYLHRELAGVYPAMKEKFGEDLPEAWSATQLSETGR